MSHCLEVLDDELMPKLALWQELEASTIMCCPVLKPHMTGEPTFPGDVREKVSMVQSPIEPTGTRDICNIIIVLSLHKYFSPKIPVVLTTAASSLAEPVCGPAMEKVCGRKFDMVSSEVPTKPFYLCSYIEVQPDPADVSAAWADGVRAWVGDGGG